MKIGIYGGAFDPVHHGHLILAREAREMLGLEKIIFVPAAVSPLKQSPTASAKIRLLILIARGRERNMITRQCIAGSTSLPRRSERELPPANRFAISYRDRSRKLLATKNFTRSK